MQWNVELNVTFLSGNSFGEDLKTFLTEDNQLFPFFPILSDVISYLHTWTLSILESKKNSN